jgi:hypothetical protein
VSVSDKFFTTNLGFLNEIIGISQLDSVGGATILLPLVLYHNNILEDCHTLGIEINLLKEGMANPAFCGTPWQNLFAYSGVQCSIASESGPLNISLWIKYDLLTTLNPPHLINTNHTSHVNACYGVMTSMVYVQNGNAQHGDNLYVSTVLIYYWNDTRLPKLQ